MKIRIPYSNTTISPERTKADIEKLLREHGIEDIQWTSFQGKTTLAFAWTFTVNGKEKGVLFEFSPPMIPTTKRTWTGMRYERVTVNLEATAYRLLWHYLKNKLEAVRWGLESMEKEFLSHAVYQLENGQETTVGEHIEELMNTLKSPALSFKKERDETKIIDAEGC